MAATDYQITTAGHAHIIHNGRVAYAGRKISADSASAAVAFALKQGWITATLTGNPVYHDSAATQQTYTVQAAGNAKLLHASVGSATTPLATAATLQLDPTDANTTLLLNRGWIA